MLSGGQLRPMTIGGIDPDGLVSDEKISIQGSNGVRLSFRGPAGELDCVDHGCVRQADVASFLA